MIKKHLSGLVTALLAAALIVSGCSSYSATTAPEESSTSAAASAGETSGTAAAADDGSSTADGTGRTEEAQAQSTEESAAAASAEGQTETTATIVTNSGRLRVRSGPGANYDIVTYLNNGDTVTVLSVEGEWAQIRTADGQEGFVSTAFLQMNEADTADTSATASDASQTAATEPADSASTASTVEEAASAETATPAEGERSATVSTSNGRLRVRSGPGADYDIVAYLNNGDTVTVLSVEGDWAQIRTADGQEGYVSTEFLQMEEADAADTAATAEDASEADTAEQAEAAGTAEEAAAADTGAQAEGERSAVVSTSNGRLRVRSGPGADYDIVAYLNDGDTVTVLSVEGDWAKIRTADGQEGYTSVEFLNIEEAPAPETDTQAESENPTEGETAAQEAEGTATISTTSGRLRVRSGPGANYDIVAYLYNGDTVTVLSIDGEWAKVRTEDGEEGYVSVSFLDMTDDTESTEAAAVDENADDTEPAEETAEEEDQETTETTVEEESQETEEPAVEEEPQETAEEGATEEISAAASRYSVYAGAVFEDLSNVRAEMNEDGSYYYEDLTADGVTVVNSAYTGRLTYTENAAGSATGEEAAAEPADSGEEAADGATGNTDSTSLVSAYLTSVLSGSGMTDISDMTVEKSEAIEENIPDEAKAEAWTASWTMKAEGNEKICHGAVICTETFTYVYYLSAPADQADAVQEKHIEIINGLTLMDGEG